MHKLDNLLRNLVFIYHFFSSYFFFLTFAPEKEKQR